MTPSDDSLRQDVQQLLLAIRDSRGEMTKRLDEFDAKLDALPMQLDAIRKEQRDATDQLRRELQAYFVAKAEFNPYQQAVQSKLAEYDSFVTQYRNSQPAYYTLVSDVANIKTDLDKLTKRGGETLSRTLSVTAVLISIIMLLLNLFQHVSIHP